MYTIIDYVERELRSISELSFNQVDSLVLSKFCYFNLGETFPECEEVTSQVTIRDTFTRENIPSLLADIQESEHNIPFIAAVASSPRFRNVRITSYVNDVDPKEQTQFSATTFMFPNGTAYIAFRGTDSTFVGWKENLNMAFITPVPAQASAYAYLESLLPFLKHQVYVGGHSKGGNLAVYAATKCENELQDHITAVFNHDGPGFKEDLLESSEFDRIANRVKKTVPQESLIGMLLQSQEDYAVVESAGIGIFQHDAFNWSVLPDEDDFAYAEHIARGAANTNKVLARWIASMSDKQRETFVDALYKIVQASGIKRLTDIPDASVQTVVKELAILQESDPDTFVIVRDTLSALTGFAMQGRLPGDARVPAGFKFLLPKKDGVRGIRKRNDKAADDGNDAGVKE